MDAQVLLGPQVVRPDEVQYVSLNDDLVGALTPGHKRTIKTKSDGNEDCLALIRFGTAGELMLVADAHFGAATSVQAIREFPTLFSRFQGSPESRLFFTHLELDRQLAEMKSKHSSVSEGCSTTLLSVWFDGSFLTWASSGDSILVLFREGKMQQINQTHHAMYLGDAYNAPHRCNEQLQAYLPEVVLADSHKRDQALLGLVQTSMNRDLFKDNEGRAKDMIHALENMLGTELSVAPKDIMTPWSPLNICLAQFIPEFGRFAPQPGDTLLMATDGIDPSVSGVPFEKLKELIEQRDKSVRERLGDVMDRVLSREGGMDNCALILKQWN
ncbi:MAG: protein phosphatase 2C domain-containing protein [Acidobacteria bacterium]|nr:protein phosphatase 2C domain-containing protein [Acidobacteriota bacterium]